MNTEKKAAQPNKLDLLEARIDALEAEVVELRNSRLTGVSAGSALIETEPAKPAIADVPFTADGVTYRLKFPSVKYKAQTCTGATFAADPALAVQFIVDFPHLAQQVEE